MTGFLPTMRADISQKRLPYGLAKVLLGYNIRRQEDSFERAEAYFSTSKWRQVCRLRRGLSRLTVRGVARMARTHANVCRTYVSQHTGDLMTLQGLFYWNGGDELVTRILLAAWRKGGAANE